MSQAPSNDASKLKLGTVKLGHNRKKYRVQKVWVAVGGGRGNGARVKDTPPRPAPPIVTPHNHWTDEHIQHFIANYFPFMPEDIQNMILEEALGSDCEKINRLFNLLAPTVPAATVPGSPTSGIQHVPRPALYETNALFKRKYDDCQIPLLAQRRKREYAYKGRDEDDRNGGSRFARRKFTGASKHGIRLNF